MYVIGQRTRRALLAGLGLMGIQGLGAMEPVGLYTAWGITNLITTNAVATVGPITQVAAGGYHALALRADGTVCAWGDNTSGQTNVPAGVSNLLAISAGARHNLGLRSDGTVVAWGLNTYGQTNVPAGLNGVMAVAAGADHSVGLRTNGMIVAWGGAALTNVPAAATNIAAIAAGATVTLALRSNGTVIAWGKADNALTNLPASLTNVAAISAGLNHCLGLRSNGTVVAWGDNALAQTGVPVQLTNATGISAGWLHSLAQRADGTYLAWGLSTSGQTTIPAGLTNLSSFAAGNTLNLGVDLAPRVLSRPAANVTLAPGQSGTLSVSILSGTDCTLQWRFNGEDQPGETNADFAITDFAFPQAGIYSLLASNRYSTASVASIVRLSNAPTVFVNGLLLGGGRVTRTNSATITLAATTNAYAKLYYSLDGSEPSFTSTAYIAPLVTSNSALLRAVSYNALFTDKAEAATVEVQVRPTYSLVTTAPGGGIGASPAPDFSPNSYLSNTVVTLTAVASNGWTFLHWAGDSTATAAVTTVVLDQPRTVQAVFGTMLNLFTNGHGDILTDPASGPFPYGSTVTLTALPHATNYFFGWAGVLSGFTNPMALTVNNASGITALFGALKSNQVALVVLPVGGGSVRTDPARNVYTNGELVTLTALSTSNRIFADWSGDASGSSNPLPVILEANRLIYANFMPGTPTNLLPVFTLLPGGRSLSAGDTTVLSATAAGIGALGYQWRFNGTPLGGATNPALALSNVTAAQAGFYDLVVGSSYGAITSPATPVALFGMELVPLAGGRLPLLIVDCAAGAQFELQYSDHLNPTNWNLLAPLTLPDARHYFIDTPTANPPERFYRLVPP